jgi:predicted transposase/invertase (TIGR01784 family)
MEDHKSVIEQLKAALPQDIAKLVKYDAVKDWTEDDTEELLNFLKDKSLLPAYDNDIFRTLLTESGVLESLITGAVNAPVSNVVIVSSEGGIENIDEKSSRYDTSAHFDFDYSSAKGQIDAEMQAHIMKGDTWEINKAIIKDRSVFYESKMIARQKAKGINYNKLRRTYSVFFLKDKAFDDERRVRHFMYRDEENNTLSDMSNIIFVEMSKLKEVTVSQLESLSALEMFGLYFGYANNPKYDDVINALIKSKKEVAVMTNVLTKISRSEAKRFAVFMREKEENDAINFKIAAFESGFEKGIIERDDYWIPQLAEKEKALAAALARLAVYEKN